MSMKFEINILAWCINFQRVEHPQVY